MKVTVPIPITPRILQEWGELLTSQPVLFFAIITGLIFTFLFIDKARKDGFRK